MYFFTMDDDIRAWRYLGMASRYALEIGLHRRDTLNRFPNQQQRMLAVRLFWSLYTMDRRFSFGIGLPFTIQDADIDPLLPEPVSSTATTNSGFHC